MQFPHPQHHHQQSSSSFITARMGPTRSILSSCPTEPDPCPPIPASLCSISSFIRAAPAPAVSPVTHSHQHCRPHALAVRISRSLHTAVPSNSVRSNNQLQQMSPATQQPTFQQQLARGAKSERCPVVSGERRLLHTIELNQVTASHDCLSWIPGARGGGSGLPGSQGSIGISRRRLSAASALVAAAGNSPLFRRQRRLRIAWRGRGRLRQLRQLSTVANRTRTTPPPLLPLPPSASRQVRPLAMPAVQQLLLPTTKMTDHRSCGKRGRDRRAADDEADDDEEADGTSGEILATHVKRCPRESSGTARSSCAIGLAAAATKNPFQSAVHAMNVHVRPTRRKTLQMHPTPAATKAYSLRAPGEHEDAFSGRTPVRSPIVRGARLRAKAFSNASDRAKHQNRTHSAEKPYQCRRRCGLRQRYTGPHAALCESHIKPCTAPRPYASKKIKGESWSSKAEENRLRHTEKLLRAAARSEASTTCTAQCQ
uniref:Uncharacterized protein n=1 Tax=Macrostomum lignano TaxID=282301 RepID=A0A1I8FG31_9PLAT